MAQDIFAPKSSFDIGYERPVARPTADDRGKTAADFEAKANNATASAIKAQTQVDSAKAGIANTVLGGISGFATGGLNAYNDSVKKTKANTLANTWLNDMQTAESLRAEGKSTEATLFERNASKSAVAAGLDLDKYKTEYESITGNQMAYVGQSLEQQQFEQLRKSDQFQTAFYAARGMLGPQASEQELTAAALTSIQKQAVASNTLALVGAGNQLDWESQTKGAYLTTLDTFDKSVVAELVARTSTGAPITPGEIDTVLLQHNLMSQQMTKPAYVSDEQWGAVQDRLTLQKEFLTGLKNVRDPDNLVADVVSQMMQSAESPEDVMAIAAAADPATFAATMGTNIPETVNRLSKTAFTDNNWKNRLQILGSLQAVDVTTPVNGNTTFTSDNIPDPFTKYINLPRSEMVKNVRAGRVFLDKVVPNSVQTEEGRKQFYNATMSVAAGMMSDKEFYSSAEISGVFNNRNIAETLNMLQSVDRDSADEIRSTLRSVANMQKTALQSNLDSIETGLKAGGYDADLVWDEADKKYYITNPQALRHFKQLIGTEGLSDKGLYLNPTNFNAPKDLKQAYDRRKSITILDRAVNDLAIEGVEDAPTTQTPEGSSAEILNFISSGEGGYGASNRGTVGDKIIGSELGTTVRGGKELTSMTIGEIMSYQSIKNPNDTDRLFAVGAYGFNPDTLKIAMEGAGMTEDTVFTAANQDRLGLELLLGSKRPELAAYIRGQSDNIEAALLEFSQEWASIPNPKTGDSYYGKGNKAKHTVAQTRKALQTARRTYASGGLIEEANTAVPTSLRPQVRPDTALEAFITPSEEETTPTRSDRPRKRLTTLDAFKQENKDVLKGLSEEQINSIFNRVNEIQNDQ